MPPDRIVKAVDVFGHVSAVCIPAAMHLPHSALGLERDEALYIELSRTFPDRLMLHVTPSAPKRR